jgi:hypothetical protein
VIGVHAKRNVLLIELQGALKHEVGLGVELAIGKAD